MGIVDPIALSKTLKAESATSQKNKKVATAASMTKCPHCGEAMQPMDVSTKFEGDGSGKLPVLVCVKDAVVVPDYS